MPDMALNNIHAIQYPLARAQFRYTFSQTV